MFEAFDDQTDEFEPRATLHLTVPMDNLDQELHVGDEHVAIEILREMIALQMETLGYIDMTALEQALAEELPGIQVSGVIHRP